MAIQIQLDEEQSRRLEELARWLNVDPIDLAKSAIDDFISRPPDEFERAAKFVLEKNRELYQRLAQ